MQAGLADITQSLKNYRPSVTVLEAQMAPSRRGEGAGGTGAPGLTAANGPDGGLVAVMEQKRNAHDQAIKVSFAATSSKHTCLDPRLYMSLGYKALESVFNSRSCSQACTNRTAATFLALSIHLPSTADFTSQAPGEPAGPVSLSVKDVWSKNSKTKACGVSSLTAMVPVCDSSPLANRN